MGEIIYNNRTPQKDARIMNERYRIVLVEDHSIVREGLRSLLSREKDFEVIGEAENGREALGLIQKVKPDLVISDLSMPQMDGMEMITTIKNQNPKIKIAVLTVHREQPYLLEALKAGADGYILKEGSYSELVLALRNILKGKRYLSPGISGSLLHGYLHEIGEKKESAPWGILTRQEREIVEKIAEGLTSKEIADQLGTIIKTVEVHRNEIMKKLNVPNASALIRVAMEKGLIHR